MTHAPKQYDAVLFDLDGTLLDTADDLGAAVNFVLREHQFPELNREQYWPLASHGARGLLQKGFAEQLNDFDFPTLRQQLLDYYHQNIAVHTRFFAGVSELLASLSTRDIPWAVVTNKPEALTHQLLRYFPEFSACQSIIGGDTLSVAKPHPQSLLLAAQQLDVTAERCLYVGDAERDMQAAKAAKMTAVLADYGYIAQSDTPEQWPFDLRIATPCELLNLL